MAKYTIIGSGYRQGSNDLEKARNIAVEAAARIGEEISIVYNYEVIAKFGPEGEIDIGIGFSPLNEITVISAPGSGLTPRVFKGRLGMLHVKEIIQSWRKKIGFKDTLPFQANMKEVDSGLLVQYNDGSHFDVLFTTLEEV